MKNTNKKGFTLVELLVVIAIVAILATVAIVGYTSFTNKAHESNDRTLVAQLNTAVLRGDGQKYASIYEVAEAVKAQGFDVAKMQATAKNHEILWNMDTQKFFYSADDSTKGKNVWVVSNEVSKDYSTYYIGASDIVSDTNTDICVVTEGRNLKIDAKNATVYHYGTLRDLTITAVASASYHEFGRVTGLTTVKEGRVVVENGGAMSKVDVIAETAGKVALEGKFTIVIANENVMTELKKDADFSAVIEATKTTDSEEKIEALLNSEAMIGDKVYDKLADAISACKAGETIVLLTDVGLTDNKGLTIAEDAVVTLDLNGFVIASTAPEAATSAVITNQGKLTIKDSAGNGKITTAALNPDMKDIPGYASNTISNKGTLVLESGTIENTTVAGAAYPVDCYQGSTFVMNGGKLLAARCALRMFCNSNTLAINVTINGGVVEGGNRGIWIQLPSTDSTKAMMANLTINGGTITGKNSEDCALYSYSYGNSFANTNVTIKGGTFNGNVCFGAGYKGDTENVTISGGTFNGYLGRYLANDGWEDIAKPAK